MASTYHQLGISAHRRDALDDAEAWYRRSLATKEVLGDHPGVASSYGQLGLLAEARGDVVASLRWIVRCATLFSNRLAIQQLARRRITWPVLCGSTVELLREA